MEVYCPLLQLFFGPCTSRKAAVYIGLERQWSVVWSQLQLEKPTQWSQPSGWVLWKLGEARGWTRVQPVKAVSEWKEDPASVSVVTVHAY